MGEFKNEYLSYSRLDQYRKCPKAFEFSYVKGLRGGGTVATEFGSACHEALEGYFGEVVEKQLSGPVDAQKLTALFERAFVEHKLDDPVLFTEGLEIMRRFAVAHGPVDELQVRGVEIPFDLPLGRFRVKGFIDRIDDLGGGHLEIIDYKTNKSPFTSEELENSLQLSLYQHVAQKLFPQAKKFTLSYWLLRHGYKQVTTRTPEQLDAHMSYLQCLGEQTESGSYPARLNILCGWCDHRDRCEDFQRAFSADPVINLNGAVGREALLLKREAVAAVKKHAENMLKELDGQIKSILDQEGQFSVGGLRARAVSKTTLVYDTAKTLDTISAQTGMTLDQFAAHVCTISTPKLKEFLAGCANSPAVGASRAFMLQASLENKATSRTTVYPMITKEK